VASASPSKYASPNGAKPRALISVSDKTGMTDLAAGLSKLGYEVISTGGSAKAIDAAGVDVTPVDEVTDFPEMLDGRVKTLHPAVHGGILARRDVDSHVAAVKEHDIGYVDVVVVNLYPFRETVASGADFASCVENIDIGGPAMIRAAAKNHPFVYVLVDAEDYQPLLDHLSDENRSDEDDKKMRKKLAWKAYQHCASYDSVVAEYLWGEIGEGAPAPERSVPMTLMDTLRYGENPHQPAAVYADASLAEAEGAGVGRAILHHGKEMSYNNYLDAEAAYSCVSDFPTSDPSCVVVKHTNPCGVASASGCDGDILEAYRQAVRADPISAFGGIVAFNCELTAEMAKEIREFRSPTDDETRMFYEIVIAPSYTEEGLEVLKGKSKNLRILEAKPRLPSTTLRQVGGGWLQQASDSLLPEDIEFEVQSETQPTPEQLEALKFAWRCVKHVKSNAITVATKGRLLGMGSGQPNRVNSVRIALEKAADEVEGSVLASDAFFPFAWGDSVEIACQAGVKAIAHPGGSMRDQEAVDVCNKYGVALVTTGHRHFRH
jgi:phosphoribosylaminoimidazolecarboxamide formyltransferase/IMP cyclohydrolase